MLLNDDKHHHMKIMQQQISSLYQLHGADETFNPQRYLLWLLKMEHISSTGTIHEVLATQHFPKAFH
jgi:hypothetical protein